MSYTTESSDWEASGPGIRYRSEPPLPGPDPPSIPLQAGFGAVIENSLPSQTSQHANSNQMKNALTATELARDEQTFAPPENVVPASATVNPLFQSDVDPSVNQNPTLAPAPRDKLFSQMVNSDDVDATPSQRAFMARGLGRGNRAGRGAASGRGSRGGRPPKIKIEPPREDADAAATTPVLQKVNRGGRPRGSKNAQPGAPIARSVNRGGRPRGSRAGMSASRGRGGGGRGGSGPNRKRKHSGEEDDEHGNSDSSEEITSLPTQSRSGRKITQVVTPTPLDPDIDSTTTTILKPSLLPKRSSLIHPSSDPLSSSKKPAKRKRVTLSAVCKNCGRGHSPQSNQIVFCDGCNTPWHQYCHDRPITPTVIQEEEKEWHCGDCEVQAEEASYMQGRIPPAEGMGLAEKRRALEVMEKGELVALLLRASNLYPDLAILKPPPPPETWTAAATAAAAAAAAAVAATTKPLITTLSTSTITPQAAPLELEYYDHPLPYPRAGNGVRLLAEADDAAILIDEDVVSYSHSWVDATGVWKGAMGVEGGGRFGGGTPRSPVAGGGVAIGVGA